MVHGCLCNRCAQRHTSSQPCSVEEKPNGARTFDRAASKVGDRALPAHCQRLHRDRGGAGSGRSTRCQSAPSGALPLTVAGASSTGACRWCCLTRCPSRQTAATPRGSCRSGCRPRPAPPVSRPPPRWGARASRQVSRRCTRTTHRSSPTRSAAPTLGVRQRGRDRRVRRLRVALPVGARAWPRRHLRRHRVSNAVQRRDRGPTRRRAMSEVGLTPSEARRRAARSATSRATTPPRA